MGWWGAVPGPYCGSRDPSARAAQNHLHMVPRRGLLHVLYQHLIKERERKRNKNTENYINKILRVLCG